MPGNHAVEFIGLGNLGRAMALRLLDRGWPLRAADIKPERVAPVVEAGAVEAAAWDPGDARIICFAVPGAAAIHAVLEDGLLDRLRPSHTVVVHSTILPAEARELAARITAYGAGFVEAPVSGGAERARSGELAVLLAGAPDAITEVRPLAGDIGKQSFELGAVGAASATKLANQLVTFASLAGLHEAFRLAASQGVAETAVLEALQAGTGDTWTGRNWGFYDTLAADYNDAGVPVSDRPWSKDVWEILTAARDEGIDLPLAGLLSQIIAPTVEAHAAAAAEREAR